MVMAPYGETSNSAQSILNSQPVLYGLENRQNTMKTKAIAASTKHHCASYPTESISPPNEYCLPNTAPNL